MATPDYMSLNNKKKPCMFPADLLVDSMLCSINRTIHVGLSSRMILHDTRLQRHDTSIRYITLSVHDHYTKHCFIVIHYDSTMMSACFLIVIILAIVVVIVC